MLVMSCPTLGFVGGIERHVFDLASGLRARGHEVGLIYGRADGAEAERYASAFAEVAPAERCDHLLGRAKALYLHKLVGSLLERSSPAIPRLVAVHDHDATCVRRHRYLPLTHEACTRAPGLSCLLHGCVVVRKSGGLVPLGLKNPARLAHSTRELAKRARLITCSHFLKGTLVAAGVPETRVQVIHPVPPDAVGRPPQPAPVSPRLLFAGQVIRGKGLDVLLRALAFVPQARLRVVGEGSSLARERARVRELGLQARVEFLGRLRPEEVEHEYDAARIVVVPSRWPEPFGMIGIEAMRRARVVVAAGHGGVLEWLEPGVTGFAFQPNDAADLARTLRRALEDPRLEEMARAAQAQAETRFSHEGMLDAVERQLASAN